MARQQMARVTRGCLEAVGANKRLAMAALDTMVDAALAADYRPVVVSWGGETQVAYQTPMGWEVGVLDARGAVRVTCSYFETKRDRADIENGMRLHLAQVAWSHGDGPESGVLAAADEATRAEFAAWTRWQNRYREVKALLLTRGFVENSAADYAHRVACGGVLLETVLRQYGERAAS